MRTGDLIAVCIQNLLRHKARTFLTVLGVVVGCCSVVIMISIGIGMRRAQEKTLAQMGDLTVIQVHAAGKGARSAVLNKKAISRMKELEGTEAVTPRLIQENVPITVYGGRDKRYRASYATIVGIDLRVAEIMGYSLTEGNGSPAERIVFMQGRIWRICLRTRKGLREITWWICTAGTWMKMVLP